MQPDTIPVLPRGVRIHADQVRDQDVLLGPERVLVLDRVGVAVLGQLDGRSSIRQISDTLAKIYEAPREVIEEDVIAFITDLQQKAMVDVASR